VDDAKIEAEAREYVEHVARSAHPDPCSIPSTVIERAVKVAADSAKELHAAVKLAQEARKQPE
jgi:hypothetical protein